MRIPSNKVKDIIRFANQELSAIYNENEIQSLSFILFEHFLGWNKSKVLLEKESTVNESDLLKFNSAIKDLKKQKPVQYITGKTNFYGLSFSVDESTLIPRPETEELVEEIIKNHQNEKLNIFDIGTGSGCLAITLSKFLPLAIVDACDISEKALHKAQENAKVNQVNVKFALFDITNKKDTLYQNRIFDIIVSNPPYIRHSEKANMNDNVLLYEPHSALFVPDNDPLVYYRHIIHFAESRLRVGGYLYFEINEALGKEAQALLSTSIYKTKLMKDINGKDRFIEAVKMKLS